MINISMVVWPEKNEKLMKEFLATRPLAPGEQAYLSTVSGSRPELAGEVPTVVFLIGIFWDQILRVIQWTEQGFSNQWIWYVYRKVSSGLSYTHSAVNLPKNLQIPLFFYNDKTQSLLSYVMGNTFVGLQVNFRNVRQMWNMIFSGPARDGESYDLVDV